MAQSRRSRAATADSDMVTTKGEQKGIFLRGADYLLSRLPFTKYKYQSWSKTKRIVVGYLLWLVVLPVIPLAIMAVMYARDPEGFKKSPAFAILSVITVAWLGLGLGYVNTQVPVDSADGKVSNGSLQNVKDRSTSEPTNGRTFENCTAAFNAGVFDIKRSDKSYEPRLDRDGDGIACER
ncbi:MAG: excalibur calcium-binding domain-containing protein [Candidatus Saccharimonadales bacterium]